MEQLVAPTQPNVTWHLLAIIQRCGRQNGRLSRWQFVSPAQQALGIQHFSNKVATPNLSTDLVEFRNRTITVVLSKLSEGIFVPHPNVKQTGLPNWKRLVAVAATLNNQN